jgi:phosphodiesterase/alkaline phosphatase D-like protein
MQVDRRRFLRLAGGAAAGVAAAGQLQPRGSTAVAATLDPGPFALGLASGDPTHDSVVLWTRLAPDPLVPGGGMPPEPVAVRWEVARDESFRHVVGSGEVTADASAAHAVHVEVPSLSPDRWYWYRFSALGEESRTGRTRTLPSTGDKGDRLRLAVASCQSWAGGAYPAYRDMAEQDVDLVFHLGDYIYETSPGSLDEFRRLHAQYKTSPDLREAHARFPFVLTWDDDEVINNYAAGIGNSPDGRPFLERRANGYPAARERILEAFADGRVSNPVVLAGDWHSSWVNDLDHDGRTVATEFAGTSISSGCGWDASVRLGLPANPQVRFYDGAYRGYLLCDITRERWRTDLRIVTAPAPGARTDSSPPRRAASRATSRAAGSPTSSTG